MYPAVLAVAIGKGMRVRHAGLAVAKTTEHIDYALHFIDDVIAVDDVQHTIRNAYLARSARVFQILRLVGVRAAFQARAGLAPWRLMELVREEVEIGVG